MDGTGSSDITYEDSSLAALGWAQRAEFQAWYNKYFLARDNLTCSQAIVVFPFNGNGGIPWYRDSTTSYSTDGIGSAPAGYMSWNLISPLNGNPEASVPVGEVGYTSRVSLVEEKFPANLEIQAAHGCDLMLLNLIREVAYAMDLPREVKTGRYMW